MQEILLSIDQNIYLALSIAFITCLVIFSISYALHAYEKLKRAEKFAKFADIEKKQKADEFKELSVNYKTSTEIVESLTDECYALICRNTELMKAFEESVAEIKVLQSKCILMEEINATLRKKLSRSHIPKDAKGLFQKIGTVKEIESEWWQLINDQDYMLGLFNTGKEYQISNLKPPSENLLFLTGNDNQPYMVYKKDFKPVPK